MRRRQLVDEVRATWKVSLRRTCQLLRSERSGTRDNGRRRSQASAAERIKEIIETRVRDGDRRVHVLLRPQGWETAAKRVHLLHKGLDPLLGNSGA